MAQEITDVIRQVKIAAESAEKDVVEQTEAVVAEAKVQGVQLRADMTNVARETVVRIEEDAEAQGEQMMHVTGVEEVEKLEAPRGVVAEKQQQAVRAISSKLP